MTPHRLPHKTFSASQASAVHKGMMANPPSQCPKGSGERRCWIRSLIAVNLILLGACAHHSLGCAFGHYYSDCKPGTTAYEEHNARAIAADIYDDAACKGEGLPVGSTAYTECRVNLAKKLDPDTRAALSAMSKLRGDQLEFEYPAENHV